MRAGPGNERAGGPSRLDAKPSPRTDAGGAIQKQTASFRLSSPAVKDGGALPVEFTGDGDSATLPLEWTGAPPETKSYAVIMHHEAPDGAKWYWILHDISAAIHSLPKNAKGVGTLGNNSVNRRREYAPPHSQGPGAKIYIYTVYALSAPPKITVPPAEVNREVLLATMKDNILATAELRVTYTRPEGTTGRDARPGPGSDRPQNRPTNDR